MTRALAATAAALAVFTILVFTGALTGIDNWAIDHVSPALNPYSDVGVVTASGLWQPFSLDAAWWDKIVEVYMYPASFLVSALLVAVACTMLLRRGQRVPALVWAGAWCAANGVELVGKLGLTRPGVHWSNGARPVHILTFDNSYPSGHSARGVVVAATLAYVFPRLRVALAAWVVLVPAALVVSGAHTLTDVVGGTTLGLLIVLAAHAMMREWTLLPIFSRVSNAASSEMPKQSSPTSPAGTSPSPTQS
jgi:membrane-associated phospholipid phosphatase